MQERTSDHRKMPESPPLRVAELFAGVGGFRVGLERADHEAGRDAFQVVWANQWEPSTKRQHAYEVYAARWPEGPHQNTDIALADGSKA